tara:strand:- start:1187 stop:1807 length:621 start_codon:yes stop_codon:yes gene_type:complete
MAEGNSPAFWNVTSVEPKRQFRWFLTVNGIPQWVLKTAKKPSFKVTETPHDFLNYKFHYPGRIEWEPIDITLVDPVQPDSTQILYKMLLDGGYVLPSNYQAQAAATKPRTISKNSFVKAFSGGGEVYLEQISSNDPNEGGQTGMLEKWAIKNPFITSCNFGDLSYENDGLVEISLTIRYDFAECLIGPDTGGDRTTGYTPPRGTTE